MSRRLLLPAMCVALAAALFGGVAAADTNVPSGQRALGQSIVEPVYDGANAGLIGFLKTAANAQVNASSRSRGRLYLPVYPAGATVGGLICPHAPVDTCPDHGLAIAGLAAAVQPAVYGGGVAGHDHLTELRGLTSHVALDLIVILFTSTEAASEHLLTTSAIDAAVACGDAIAIPLAPAALHAEQVPINVWTLATPVA